MYESFEIYDDDDAQPSKSKSKHHHPRRSAASRRQQRLRAEARTAMRLLKGLESIDSHRGNTLSPLGQSMRMAIHETFGFQSRQVPLCRHYAAGRCTFGNSCRFAHISDMQDQFDEHHDASEQHVNCDDSGTEDEYSRDERAKYDSDVDYASEHIENTAGFSSIAEPQNNFDSAHPTSTHALSGMSNPVRCDLRGGLRSEERCAKLRGTEDDIGGIIQNLGALQEQEQQQAFETLPMHLLHEVQERLLQATRDHDTLPETVTHDMIEQTFDVLSQLPPQKQVVAIRELPEHIQKHVSLKVEERKIHARLQHSTLMLLQVHNWNKKLVGSIVGYGRLREHLSQICDRPGYRLGSELIANTVDSECKFADRSSHRKSRKQRT